MNKKAFIEKTAKLVFLVCAVVAIFAVCAITIYMFIKGAPALKEVGIYDLLFGTVWKPTNGWRHRMADAGADGRVV